MTEPCPVKGCPVTRPHWHCACGEPCEVGEEECDGCWAWDDEFSDREAR